MNDRIYMVISMIALLSVQGCGYNQMSYFRKHGATVPDERREWGLCGGNFLPDGQLYPVVDTEILQCMLAKGFQSVNDYYEEQRISFINRSDPTSLYVPNKTLDECGFQTLQVGLCSDTRYITKSRLSRAIPCISAHGYEATLPRGTRGFIISEDDRGPNPNFCTFLTPKNRKGTISFGYGSFSTTFI